jgi:hypothetical protein
VASVPTTLGSLALSYPDPRRLGVAETLDALPTTGQQRPLPTGPIVAGASAAGPRAPTAAPAAPRIVRGSTGPEDPSRKHVPLALSGAAAGALPAGDQGGDGHAADPPT